MAHQFTVNAIIRGVSIDEFKRLANDISLHEAVCHRILLKIWKFWFQKSRDTCIP